MTHEDDRPDPDALLAALAESEGARARLKVFLGAAPGVGKTWEMLTQARRKLAAGEDVVAGLIETHGRAETQAQLGDLPILQRRPMPYRGRMLDEFDLDAALARRPGLLLVDELAHTNAFGSRHAKRWEDVAELLAAGVAVWTTLNVQHLESLNDDIARITGIRPTETLPDRVLEMADEIELIDVPPAELQSRLRDGKIYGGENAARALRGFFGEGNLAALREIALRRTAAHVDGDVRNWMRRTGVAGPWPTGERILALVGADAAGEAVVRQAKRLADAFEAPWAALHVELPGPGSGSGAAARASLALAAQLGAETEVAVPGEGDLVSVILRAARARNATHLVAGRPPAPFWRRLFGRHLGARLIREAEGCVLHLVPAPTRRTIAAVPRPVGQWGQRWAPYAAVVLLLAVATVTGHVLRDELPTEAADMVYLAIVVGAAAVWGTGPGLFAAATSVVVWDFFFIRPYYTVTIDSLRDILTGLVFAITALLTGALAGRVRREERAAAARIDGLRRIGEFSRLLGEPTTEPELLAEIARQAAGLAGAAVVLTAESDDIGLRVAEPAEAAAALDEGGWAAARWAWTSGESTGRGTSTLPSTAWRFLPLRTLRGRLGIVGVRSAAALDEPRRQALEALVDQAAISLERVHLTLDAARTAALEETQRLRTALLASLGHDLRTPLASIQGAAGTLSGMGDRLEPATRADLLASIEEDVSRMTRFLGSITELTRLESGEIRPELREIVVLDVVEAAVARLPDAMMVAVRVDAALRAWADPTLLEQALFNVLDNAMKYSPAGSLVRISAQDGKEVVIEVADEGVGIAAAELPRIFDSFFRASRGDRVASGTGLGLAITRGLVEAMGGRIGARSPRPDAAREGLPGTVVGIALRRAGE